MHRRIQPRDHIGSILALRIQAADHGQPPAGGPFEQRRGQGGGAEVKGDGVHQQTGLTNSDRQGLPLEDFTHDPGKDAGLTGRSKKTVRIGRGQGDQQATGGLWIE